MKNIKKIIKNQFFFYEKKLAYALITFFNEPL